MEQKQTDIFEGFELGVNLKRLFILAALRNNEDRGVSVVALGQGLRQVPGMGDARDIAGELRSAALDGLVEVKDGHCYITGLGQRVSETYSSREVKGYALAFR